MLGGLNSDIGQAQNPRSQQVAHLLIKFGLVDLFRQFQQNWQFLHMKTWSQFLRGGVLQTRCDYILGKDWLQFKMVVIKDVRNYSSDHFTLWARLL